MISSKEHFKIVPRSEYKAIEKNNFVIFTSDEEKLASTIKDQKLKDYLLDIMKRMNNGSHSPNGGWYGHIKSTANEDKRIITGLERYIQAAHKLQSEKNGERVSKIIGQHGYESFVNVYSAFWDQCYRNIFIAFADKIMQLQRDEFAEGRDKSFVYVLLQLKQDKLLTKWFDEKQRHELHVKIDKAISHIRTQTHLTSFQLEAMDESRSVELYKGLIRKTYQLDALRSLLETHTNATLLKTKTKAGLLAMHTSHARYTHVRPAIMIQYLQKLDFFMRRYDEIHKKSPLSFQKEQKDPVREMLLLKQEEMRQVIIFQQKLYETYGKDDFIEILHHVIENVDQKDLPLQDLFEYDKSIDFSLFAYDPEYKDIPPKVSMAEHSQWRKEYLKNANLLKDIKPLEEKKIMFPDIKKETPGFVPLQNLFFAVEDKLIKVRIPEKLKHNFLELFKKDIVQFKELAKYFSPDNGERKDFYKVNHYHKDFEFLIRQVNDGGVINFLSLSKTFTEEKINSLTSQIFFFLPNKSNENAINYLRKLSNALAVFNGSYEQEIKLSLKVMPNPKPTATPKVEDEKKLVWQKIFNPQLKTLPMFNNSKEKEKKLFLQSEVKLSAIEMIGKKYRDVLKESKANFIDQVKKILDYWLDSIVQRKHEFVGAEESIKEFMEIINQIILKLKDKNPYLIIKYHSVEKYLEKTVERRMFIKGMG